MVKLEIGIDKPETQDEIEKYLAEPAADAEKGLGQRLGSVGELFKAHPLLSKRIAALRKFADGALYVQLTGGDPAGHASTDDIDKQVADLLSVF
jgi:hypothetical protein